MQTSELISDIIPSLKPFDNGSKALGWMEEMRISHLPIVDGRKYLGLISETDVNDINDLESPLKNYDLLLPRPFVLDIQHVYEAMKLVSDSKISVVPVLDTQEKYKGVFSAVDLAYRLAETAGVSNPGGILVLQLSQNDYSMSEIARITEGNDCIILSSYITSHPDSTKLELTIKLNKSDLGPVIQSFNRYGYTVLGSYQESEHLGSLEYRYNNLMNYLNV